MERYKFIYIDTTTAPAHPIVVETRMANHWEADAFPPTSLTPLMAIVVDLETGKAASFLVTTVRAAHLMYTEGGFGAHE